MWPWEKKGQTEILVCPPIPLSFLSFPFYNIHIYKIAREKRGKKKREWSERKASWRTAAKGQLFFSETRFHVARANFEFAWQPRMILNLWSFSLAPKDWDYRCATMPGLWCWVLNTGLCTCYASTRPAELHLSPRGCRFSTRREESYQCCRFSVL